MQSTHVLADVCVEELLADDISLRTEVRAVPSRKLILIRPMSYRDPTPVSNHATHHSRPHSLIIPPRLQHAAHTLQPLVDLPRFRPIPVRFGRLFEEVLPEGEARVRVGLDGLLVGDEGLR